MAVEEKQQSPEVKQAEAESQEIRERDFANKLINTFDLNESLKNSLDNHASNEEEKNSEEDEKEEVKDEPQQDTEENQDSSESQEEVSEEKVEESDEDLIPKSKVQKRIDELVKQNKKIEAELRSIKEQKTVQQESSRDHEMEKLEAMSDAELKSLKREIKMAQLSVFDTNLEPAQKKAKIAELMELEDKADKAISTAPSRFQNKQINNLNSAIAETELDNKSKEVVFGYAKTIFASSPELQSSVTGQARAWEMAVKHFSEINKLSKNQTKAEELKRQNTNLKKKISVETSSQKLVQKPNDEARIYNKAKSGTFDDKVEFFRKRMNTDSYIPEEFRPRG